MVYSFLIKCYNQSIICQELSIELFYYMYSRILFVPDFTRKFFVRCAQIYEVYLDGMLIRFVCIWRKISRKSRYKREPESTLITKKLFQRQQSNCPFPLKSKEDIYKDLEISRKQAAAGEYQKAGEFLSEIRQEYGI